MTHLYCTCCGKEIVGTPNLIAGDTDRTFCNKCFLEILEDDGPGYDDDEDCFEPIGSCDD